MAFASGFAEAFFKELKDVFPEGSWADNLFEGLYAAFKSLNKLFTNNTEWERFKVTWQLTWNDLKLSALEAWNGVLRAFGDTTALEKNQSEIDKGNYR